MKSYIKKLISLVLVFLFCTNTFIINSSAASYVIGANDASDSYKEGIYYKNLSDIPLTQDGRTDVLAVALSQIGYQEGPLDNYSGTIGSSDNYTEFNWNMGDFGAGYGGSSYPWCASFVSFCLLQAGCHNQTSMAHWCRNHKGDKNYIWREVSCNQWASQLRSCGYFKYSSYYGGKYIPRSGDLIFFTENGKLETHIGLVLYATSTKVYTVEGNTSSSSGLDTNGGGVYTKSYDLNNSYIYGYGILPYKTNDSIEKIDYSGDNPTTGLYVSTTNKYIYENEKDKNYTWYLPKYSMFEVIEITDNGNVKAICNIDGDTVTGYIKNNSNRIIQLYSSKNTLNSITITNKPYKLIYTLCDSLDTTGMVVFANYKDGSSEEITDYTVIGDMEAIGTQTITVSYGGMTATFQIDIVSGHTLDLVGNIDATCQANGYTGDEICTDCGKILNKGKIIPQKNHNSTTEITKATLKSNGKTIVSCLDCGTQISKKTLYKVTSLNLSKTEYTYDSSKTRKPSVTIKDSKGNKLKKGTDYDVDYPSGRTKVGKYKVKITLKGNYSGTKTLYFEILPRPTTIKSISAGSKKLTVKWSKKLTQSTGYQLQYSTSSSFKKKYTKTITITDDDTTSKTIKKLL